MKFFSVDKAQEHLESLIERALDGEDIVIIGEDNAAVQIKPLTTEERPSATRI
jgi:antitoxin (DNA-binding transcriptional repressor) of toxin-antitoxin stability system